MASGFHVRSVSFPSRSHPTALKVEEELNKLKTWEVSSTTTSRSICDGLSGLEDLFSSLNDFLNMESTQEVLLKNKDKKCVNQLLEGSVRLLDVCALARDALLKLKEQAQILQSSLRRRTGESSSIASYAAISRAIKKDAKKWIVTLKQTDTKLTATLSNQNDDHLVVVIHFLREVNVINSSVFQSLLIFLSPPASKSKWFLVSKMMKKGVVRNEENELESVNCALEQEDQSAKKRLEELENRIEEMEKRLECVFRCLIRTRTSILNIFSQ